MEAVGKELKKQRILPKNKRGGIIEKVFKNIILAIIVVVYFVLLNIAFINFDETIFTKIIQIASVLLLIITIVLFEISYKKDNDQIAIHGIESLALSICTLLSIFISIKYTDKFIYIVNTISMFFAIYYVLKSIIIYSKMKKEILKKANDISEI